MWNLVSSGPAGVSTLGLCGIQFRLTEDRSPQDPCVFGFGALWGSVQADGIWSPQELLGVQMWDIVGFSSVQQEMAHHSTYVVSAL